MKYAVCLVLCLAFIDLSLQAAPAKVDCSALLPEEQEFAGGLNVMNRQMFCQQFNVDQRKAAMMMVGQQDAQGKAMDRNAAVEKVATENSLMTAPPRGGACPAGRSSGQK